MAQVKISQLPANVSPVGSEELIVANGGVSQRMSVDTLSTHIGATVTISHVNTALSGITTAENIEMNALSAIITGNFVDYFVYETKRDSDNGNRALNQNNTASLGNLKSRMLLTLSGSLLSLIDFSNKQLSVVHSWVVLNATHVSAKNGIIAVTEAAGLLTINLFTDEIFIHDGINKQKSNQTAATFDQSTSVWSVINTTDILASSSINDSVINFDRNSQNFATTTGLIAESILTGTSTGATIFNNDGTVVNFTGAVGIISVDINDNGMMVLCSTTDVYVFNSTKTVNTLLSAADYIFNSASTPAISGTISKVLFVGNDIIVGTTTGTHTIKYNSSLPATSTILNLVAASTTRLKLNKIGNVLTVEATDGLTHIQNDTILDSALTAIDMSDLGYERIAINNTIDMRVNRPLKNIQNEINKFEILDEKRLKNEILTQSAALASAMSIALG